jgi:hypothetical protein
VGRHSVTTSMSTKNKLILSFSVASIVVAAALPSMAQAATVTGFSTITRDECAQALTWPDRTDEQKAWLTLCKDALTPPTATPTITPSVTVTPSITVNPTTPPPTTAPPSPTVTPTATATPSPTPSPSGGYTKPQDVGVPANTVLTAGGPCTIDSSNVTYNARSFDCDGMRVNGQNVKITKSYITTGQWWSILIAPNASLILEDSTIGGPNACSRDASISGGNVTIRRINMTTGGDGFWISGPNYLASNSYIKLCGSGGTHADGIQLSGTGGNNSVIDNVTFDMSFTELNAQNSPVFWSGSSQGNNATIKNSLMIAGGYTLRVHSGTGMSLINNVIKRNAWQFGPTLIDSGRVSVCIGNSVANVDSNYNVTNKTSIGC